MDWRFDHLLEKVITWFALFMEDRQAQDQCKEGTTLPLCDAKTSKNNYSERRKCATTLPGTVLDMSEWSSFNYAQGKTDTKTNFVVTISFTTKVDHQTTSKIWPDVWSCLMIDLGHETDGNNEICLGVCFALCLNHIHVLKWWTTTLAKKIETAARTWHRRVIYQACTRLCLACVPVSIFLARVVVENPGLCYWSN